MRAHVRIFFLFALGVGLLGCLAFPPVNNVSEYLSTETGGFIIGSGDKSVRYALTVTAARAIPAGAVLDVSYANPLGGEPLASTTTVADGVTKFVLVSPAIAGLRANEVYTVEVKIFADASRQVLLGTHTQQIRSSFTMPPD